MKRLSRIACGAAAGLLAIVFVCSTGAQNDTNNRPAAGRKWRLAEPINYKNMSVFPVVSDQPDAAGTSHFTTLDEALGSGQAVVKEKKTGPASRRAHGQSQEQEGPSVNRLVLIYRGSKPLLLLSGELVQGGDQDRIISQDRIVMPGGDPLPLDVFCVEPGRWSSGENFASGRMMVHPSVREKAAVDQEQTKVWDALLAGSTAGVAPGVTDASSANVAVVGAPQAVVRATPPAINTTSATLTARTVSVIVTSEASTSSYRGIYRSSRVEESVRPFDKEIKKRFAHREAELKGEDVVGVVVAYGPDVAWSDIFASPALFDLYWPKLRRSYVVEALARPQTAQHPSFDDATKFLQSSSAEETIRKPDESYDLRSQIETGYAEISLEALQPVPVSLHTVKIHRTTANR